MEKHYILCGLGRIGWRVLDYLRAAGVEVVVIDLRCDPSDRRLQGVQLIRGDCRQEENLHQAEVGQADGMLILTSDDLVNLSTALLAHQLNPGIRVVVRMFNQELVARLGNSGRLRALSASALTAPVLALIARTGEAFGVFECEGLPRQQVSEVVVRAGTPLAGLRLGEVEERYQVRLLAHVPRGLPPKFLHALDPQAVLVSGDRLVVCAEPGRLEAVRRAPDEVFSPELLWANYIRRLVRVAWRTLAEVDLPVKICTAILLVFIVGSTLIFHFTMRNDTIPDALYRTISLMATGADMGGRELEPGAWQKVYVSMLRIVGAALTAAFTAILTNYLVRAQLGGALEVRRIPESGHIIVCGLGNVGSRVVEELLHENCRVVAIERSRDNPWIGTMRRKGAAVIVASASNRAVLRQVNATQAAAVVAATDNELVNLEITLLVREMNPRMRVVVRVSDHRLAKTLREVTGVKLAMSLPDLAAPAFVAELFGDRVRSVFFVEGRLLGAIELVVQSDDPVLHGRKVSELAQEYRLRPLSVLDANGVVVPALAEATLQAGWRLTALTDFADLQALLQRTKGEHKAV